MAIRGAIIVGFIMVLLLLDSQGIHLEKGIRARLLTASLFNIFAFVYGRTEWHTKQFWCIFVVGNIVIWVVPFLSVQPSFLG